MSVWCGTNTGDLGDVFHFMPQHQNKRVLLRAQSLALNGILKRLCQRLTDPSELSLVDTSLQPSRQVIFFLKNKFVASLVRMDTEREVTLGIFVGPTLFCRKVLKMGLRSLRRQTSVSRKSEAQQGVTL